MARSTLLFGLILAFTTPAALADDTNPANDDAGVFVEISYFSGGRAKLEDVQLWNEQLEKEMELAPDEDVLDPQSKRELKIARVKMKQIQGKLGREIRVKYYFSPKAALVETDLGRKRFAYTLIRLDVDKPFYAVWNSKSKRLTKVNLETLKGNRNNESVDNKFDGLSGKKMTILGEKAIQYRVGGGMGGEMYVGEMDRKGLPTAQQFCERARTLMGGYKGEILFASINQAQFFPMLGVVKDASGGLKFDGTAARGAEWAFSVRKVEHRKAGDVNPPAPDLSIPKGMTVKEVGF